MKKLQANHKRIIYYTLGSIVGILIILGVWLYTGSLTNARISVFSALHAPLAVVDGRFVMASQLRHKIDLAGGTPGQPLKLTKQEAFNAIIQDARTRAVADKYAAGLPKEVAELAYRQVQGDSNLPADEFEAYLRERYRLSSDEFKRQVLTPLYTEIYLRAWYAQNQSLQKDSAVLMESLQTKLQNGQNFAELAKTYSQDEATKVLGGSLGIISEQKLLPELAYELSESNEGVLVIAGSRLGVHLIQIEDIGENPRSYLARHIFLAATGFDEWLTREQAKVRTFMFVSEK